MHFVTLHSLYSRSIPVGQISNMTMFRQKQLQGNIDVWWLYDDGGKNQNMHFILKIYWISRGTSSGRKNKNAYFKK